MGIYGNYANRLMETSSSLNSDFLEVNRLNQEFFVESLCNENYFLGYLDSCLSESSMSILKEAGSDISDSKRKTGFLSKIKEMFKKFIVFLRRNIYIIKTKAISAIKRLVAKSVASLIKKSQAVKLPGTFHNDDLKKIAEKDEVFKAYLFGNLSKYKFKVISNFGHINTIDFPSDIKIDLFKEIDDVIKNDISNEKDIDITGAVLKRLLNESKILNSFNFLYDSNELKSILSSGNGIVGIHYDLLKLDFSKGHEITPDDLGNICSMRIEALISNVENFGKLEKFCYSYIEQTARVIEKIDKIINKNSDDDISNSNIQVLRETIKGCYDFLIICNSLINNSIQYTSAVISDCFTILKIHSIVRKYVNKHGSPMPVIDDED